MKKQLTTLAVVAGTTLLSSAMAATVSLSGQFRTNFYPIHQKMVGKSSGTESKDIALIDNDHFLQPAKNPKGFFADENLTALTAYNKNDNTTESAPFGRIEDDLSFGQMTVNFDSVDAYFRLRVYASGYSRTYFSYAFAPSKGFTGTLHLEHTFHHDSKKETGFFLTDDAFNRDNYITLKHTSGFFVSGGYGGEGQAQQYKGLTAPLLADEAHEEIGAKRSLINYVEQPFHRMPYLALGYDDGANNAEVVLGVGSEELTTSLAASGTNPATTKASYNLLRLGLNGGTKVGDLELGVEANIYRYKANETGLDAIVPIAQKG